MHIQTKVCELLGITYPIVLAGMAGGPSTAELVAAVSNAGGLGTLGAAYMKPDEIRESIQHIRQLTDAPFSVNLFVEQKAKPSFVIDPKVQVVLNQFRNELGISKKFDTQIEVVGRFESQFAVLLEEEVPIISTAFGLLSEKYRQQVTETGTKIISMVTTVQEAKFAEEAGCDVIVAQGTEAGGHRGTFDVSQDLMGANIGLFSLLPQIVKNVRIPVLAAGGIMDGRGIQASLVLGAQGVQMGTRFLTAKESGTHPVYKQTLLTSKSEDTVLTNAFSGRPARGIVNRFISQWNENRIDPLEFPIQNMLTRDIRDAASEQNNPDYMSLWAGQGVGMLTKEQTVQEIFYEIMAGWKS